MLLMEVNYDVSNNLRVLSLCPGHLEYIKARNLADGVGHCENKLKIMHKALHKLNCCPMKPNGFSLLKFVCITVEFKVRCTT
jgi:hypothetical protein